MKGHWGRSACARRTTLNERQIPHRATVWVRPTLCGHLCATVRIHSVSAFVCVSTPCMLLQKNETMFTYSLLFHYSSCLLILSVTHTQRGKEEATRGFLTSWPSDKIESVLLPSPTKGLWKRRVSSWLGLRVATDGGKPGGRKGRKRGNNAMHIYLFKLSICCVAWAWLGHSIYTQAHTHTSSVLLIHTHRHKFRCNKGRFGVVFFSYTSHHHEVHNYWFFLMSLHFAKS